MCNTRYRNYLNRLTASYNRMHPDKPKSLEDMAQTAIGREVKKYYDSELPPSERFTKKRIRKIA